MRIYLISMVALLANIWLYQSALAQEVFAGLDSPNCNAVFGIDTNSNQCDQYFTRGKPEYQDFCCGCVSSDFYASLFAGGGFPSDLSRSIPGLPIDSLDVSLTDGGVFGGAIGRYWNQRVRSEFEFSYANNSVTNLIEWSIVNGFPQITSDVPATGTFERYSGLANLTFDLTRSGTWKPNIYAGVGAGVVYANGQFTTAADVIDTNDASFAWQWLLGTEFRTSQRGGIFVEYRFFQAESINLTDVVNGQSLGDFELQSHDVTLGLRYRF